MVRARSFPSISSWSHAATYQQLFRNMGCILPVAPLLEAHHDLGQKAREEGGVGAHVLQRVVAENDEIARPIRLLALRVLPVALSRMLAERRILAHPRLELGRARPAGVDRVLDLA